MNSEPPIYRYFAHPHQFSTYYSEPRPCDLCGELCAGYEGPVFGERDLDAVCENCLVVGKLVDVHCSTNEGDSEALRQQLQQNHPDLKPHEIEVLVQERTAELEYRTPHLLTWQSHIWPAHCGNYCRYIKEVGEPDLIQLAPDGNGPAFLAAHAPDIDDLEYAQEIWEGIRPDSPTDNHTGYSVGVYLFQCLHCERHVILWDCD